jgi:hypothetical protein
LRPGPYSLESKYKKRNAKNKVKKNKALPSVKKVKSIFYSPIPLSIFSNSKS